MADNDPIKDKIRKLLAKANNTACTVEEAEAFNRKAYELMERYNLDRAEVEKDKEAVRTHKTLEVLVRPWATSVLAGITHLYFCKWFYTKTGARSHTVTLIGEENNVAVCHAIAVMVLRAVQQEAKRQAGGRSFMTGAGTVIHRRCYEMRPANQIAKTATSGNTNALVVLGNQEMVANTEYLQNVLGVGRLRTVKSQARVTSSTSLDAGRRFGETVNLRHNLLR